MKKYINLNYFWTSLFVEQVAALGVKNVCISTGSRNTPLTLAFAENKKIKKYIHVDERSCGFFALGLAKYTNSPIAIVTTSGTAVAELYPAIIEAYIQRIPLIICTADRPSYLRNTGANQTINQDNIFVNHIRKFIDFGLPYLTKKNLNEFCEKIVKTVSIATKENSGPVHLNFPFVKPLEPNTFTEKISFKISDFIISEKRNYRNKINEKDFLEFLETLKNAERPLIHCGWDNFNNEFYKSLQKFSTKNNIPIFVDGTSELRFIKSGNKNIISNHTAFIENIDEEPDLIIHLGNAPTSQIMLRYFENSKAERILINEFGDIKDPSTNKGRIIKCNPLLLLNKMLDEENLSPKKNDWLKKIQNCEVVSEKIKHRFLANLKFGSEPKVSFEILNCIEPNSNVFISNSLPIRDFDYFASKRKLGLKIFTNRGASGIDGIISTASGIAATSKNQTYLIIGDLAFYHNVSALSTLNELKIPLKIILVNNNGGGIFNMLPIANDKENFEEYFITAQNLEFSKIVKAFGGNYYLPKTWHSFKKYLIGVSKNKNFSVIEIQTDSIKSVEQRKDYWEQVKAIL